MSQRLKQRQEKIQEKRKKTPWREFVMEICSWRNLMFYKTEQGVSKYPQVSGKEMSLVSLEQWKDQDSSTREVEIDKNFLEQLDEAYHSFPYPVVNHYGHQENAQRGDEVWGAKNTYLSVAVGDGAENVIYSFKGETNVSNVISSSNVVQNCENIRVVKFSVNRKENEYR